MEYLKKIINEELKDMLEEDRQILKKTVLITYNNILEEFKNKIDIFEERVLASLNDKKRVPEIYTKILYKEDLYLYENEFYPVIIQNIDKIFEYSIREVLTTESKELVLEKIYIDLSFNELKKIENIIFKVDIHTKNNSYLDISCTIKRDNSYIMKIKSLYDVLNINGVNWKTINMSHFYKMYKVVIEDIDFLSKVENIDDLYEANIDIDYGEYKSLIYENKIVTWNIEEKEVIGTKLVKPKENKIYYEHILKFNNQDNIYIYPTLKGIFLVYIDEENNIRVVTENDDIEVWKIWEIKTIYENKYNKIKDDIKSNVVKNSFINTIRLQSKIRIRSEFEIMRIYESYDFLGEYFEYIDFVIDDENQKIKDGTYLLYDMNEFITNEYKMKTKKSNLYLYINIKKIDTYTEDIMSFFASEVEYYFPEFNVFLKSIDS